MRNYLIGFLILILSVYGCSFNKMFMHPDKLEARNIKLRFFDQGAKDTLMIFTDTLLKPFFSKVNGKMYSYPFESRNVFFENNKGEKLQGWIFKADDEINNGISILFLHGNAGSIFSHVRIVKPLVEKGFNVFVFDYSGFGYSEGKAKRKQLPNDAQAALEFYLKQIECKGKKVIIYGQSLGGHLALEVAKNNQDKIKGVVIEGAFTNHDEIGAEAFKPGFIAKMMIREYYNGLKNIKKLKIPVMVIHSINDETIPFFMGEKLYKAANSPKQFYQLEKCHVCGPIYYSDSIKVKIERMLK
jgi:pimeloyl-ACP methyl ester carboxylesterase